MSEINVTGGEVVQISIENVQKEIASITNAPATEIYITGLVGSTGAVDKFYIHNQNDPQSIWVIEHGLAKRPSVTVVDSAENVVFGEIEYNSENQVTLTFAGAFSGKAYFN